MTPILELTQVSRHFGSLRAVDDVSLSVADGARHAVIGPNGAGKSTLFAVIAGTLRQTAGRIVLAEEDVSRMPEHRRARLGIGRTFQQSSLFLRETARENVLLAVQRHAGAAWSMLRPVSRRRELLDRAQALLDEVRLGDRHSAPVGSLSHGERRQLEVAVALAVEPRVLLLDEPAAGMSPAETARLTELLASLSSGVTLLLIEHDLDVVFEIASTVTVMHLGHHVMTGTPAEVRASEEVHEAYLGAAAQEDAFAQPARPDPRRESAS